MPESADKEKSDSVSGSGELTDSKDVETQTPPEQPDTDRRPCFFRYITAITRTWGFLTCIGLWYCTVSLLQDHQQYVYIPWYDLCVSIIVTLLEFVWIIAKCAHCQDDGNCCCTCWRIVLWLDNWKKSVVYILLSIPTFTRGKNAVLSIICGVLVLVLAVFYLFKTCKYSECIKRKKKEIRYVDTDYPKANLVSHEVQTATSDYAAAGHTYTTLDQMSGDGSNGSNGTGTEHAEGEEKQP